MLPPLEQGDTLKLLGIDTKDHKTTPPPNYNEASLIKTLEKHGIGRPSTYAPTIKTIMDRKYREKQAKGNKLIATDLGITVTEQLKEFFKDIMDLSYTAGVEETLDDIAEGDKKWVEVISGFYSGFTRDLDNASKNMRKPAPSVAEGEQCPICGSPMVRRRSKYGEYLTCINYPDKCQGKKNLSGSSFPAPEETAEKCEKCGSPMVIRTGRKGRFMACSAYPKCRNTYSVDAQGNRVASSGPLDSGRKCEKCGKPLVLRHSAKGAFLGCSGYPKCKNIVNITPEEEAAIKKLNEKKDA